MDLISRIKDHNAWRRGEHDNMTDPTQLGKDLELIVSEYIKLEEQNNLMRDVIHHENINSIIDWTICGIATNSSSGSLGRKERMEKFTAFNNTLKAALDACQKQGE